LAAGSSRRPARPLHLTRRSGVIRRSFARSR
jgi:hypothetical protein